MHLTGPAWRKSRRSSTDAQCVLVHSSLTLAGDTKDPEGNSIPITPEFMRAVKAGQFDPR